MWHDCAASWARFVFIKLIELLGPFADNVIATEFEKWPAGAGVVREVPKDCASRFARTFRIRFGRRVIADIAVEIGAVFAGREYHFAADDAVC
ncbi:hypothetical protein CSW57_03995 [Williamsia muralis]|uniref:Uncharacterized protein n=1 Tax=Williamsia marianensis TaxID=85044 RepID=A0A2G3PRG6_WILMA|nr:hypothetical protein CSW57_03995 [Williamsia marianensis]